MKQKHIFILVFLMLMLLGVVGCQRQIAPEPTAAMSSTPSSSVTTSLKPTKTVTVTATLTYTPSPILDPRDFNGYTIKTVTPAEPAQCPAIDPDITFDWQLYKSIFDNDQLMDQKQKAEIDLFLNHLNAGGSTQAIMDGQSAFYGYDASSWFDLADLTGDNIDEVIMPSTTHGDILILSCRNNQYEVLQTFSAYFPPVHPHTNYLDLNNNGLSEIGFDAIGCMGSKCTVLDIYEWNGNEFVLLFNGNDISMWGPFTFTFEDIDQNGTQEIFLTNSIYSLNSDPLTFPARKETLTYMWNGNLFLPVSDDFDTPIYRFQAVQDGDRQMRLKLYPQAIQSYRRVIDDMNLQWFSEDRQIVEFFAYMDKLYNISLPDATPTPALFEDPHEYPILASYAYYRIALIYLLQYDLASAQNIYEERMEAFPADQVGGAFTKLTETLLLAYQESANMTQSCIAVNKAISQNSTQFENYAVYFNFTDWLYQIENLCAY